MDGSQNRLERVKPAAKGLPGQVVLVLQGGGALGSYQAGVYQALHEAGIEPDWIIGTSIGAINASLIAGNEAPNRHSGCLWYRKPNGISGMAFGALKCRNRRNNLQAYVEPREYGRLQGCRR